MSGGPNREIFAQWDGNPEEWNSFMYVRFGQKKFRLE